MVPATNMIPRFALPYKTVFLANRAYLRQSMPYYREDDDRPAAGRQLPHEELISIATQRTVGEHRTIG